MCDGNKSRLQPSYTSQQKTINEKENIMNRINISKNKTTAAMMLFLCASLLASQAETDRGFKQINLVSDQPGKGRYTDPYLINPWGVAFVFGDLAVADNHAGVATFYEPSGRPVDLVIPIPSAADPNTLSSPTDFAFNEAALRVGSSFKVQVGTESVP